MARTLVLAYSGGLDTSVAVRWLAERDYDVICFCADVGQGEDLARASASDFAYDHRDAHGFIRLQALRLRIRPQ